MKLKELCSIHAPSGSEFRIKEILLKHIHASSRKWKTSPVITENGIKDNLILSFGKPRTVIFCHIDTTGFTVRYNNHVIPIGSPQFDEKSKVRSFGSENSVNTFRLKKNEDHDFRLASRKNIKPGTTLTFAPEFIENKNDFTGPYLDNRAGIYVCLKLAEELRNGLIVFTAYEEHGGGSVEFLAPYIYNIYGISKALICDMTWESESVKKGKGMVVSLRDKYIPRESYLKQITGILEKKKICFQNEVEGSGSSDGGYLQKASVPFDWCFCGVAVSGMHSASESACLNDLNELKNGLMTLMDNL
jgi:putative aminopeptidase FrvX